MWRVSGLESRIGMNGLSMYGLSLKQTWTSCFKNVSTSGFVILLISLVPTNVCRWCWERRFTRAIGDGGGDCDWRWQYWDLLASVTVKRWYCELKWEFTLQQIRKVCSRASGRIGEHGTTLDATQVLIKIVEVLTYCRIKSPADSVCRASAACAKWNWFALMYRRQRGKGMDLRYCNAPFARTCATWFLLQEDPSDRTCRTATQWQML